MMVGWLSGEGSQNNLGGELWKAYKGVYRG